MKKLTEICKLIFGYGIMIVLFAGGLTFFGYLLALIVGGEAAVMICDLIYKQIIPLIVKASTLLVLFGLVCMYMSGEKSLTPSEKKKKITSRRHRK